MVEIKTDRLGNKTEIPETEEEVYKIAEKNSKEKEKIIESAEEKIEEFIHFDKRLFISTYLDSADFEKLLRTPEALSLIPTPILEMKLRLNLWRVARSISAWATAF